MRVYTVTQPNVAVSGAQDMVEITAGSTTGVLILSAFIGQVGTADAGDANAEHLRILIRRYATSGSNGSSQTPAKHNSNDPASSATAEVSNTTAGGTVTEVIEESFPVANGWFYQPIPEERIYVPPGGIIAFRIPSVADGITLTARVTFAEV
jgi:hypothetical protein